MTGEQSPLTHRTPEELIALLMAGLLSLVFSLLDATFTPSTHRDRLHAAFADLFARLEAQLIAAIQHQIALTALKHGKSIPTPIPNPVPTGAPTATSPTAEAPHPTRAPAPHHPTRAPQRAVTPPTIVTLATPPNFQKTAFTASHSHAQIVALS